jgi:hypothetical protein
MTTPDTLTDPIIHIPTDDLRRMTDRAYWSAAYAWQEYRNDDELSRSRHYNDALHPDLERMLREAAESADDYYDRLSIELHRRDES